MSVCFGLCGFVSVCVGLCGSVWVCMGLCESVLVCVGLCQYVWVCIGLCQSVWICVGLCGSHKPTRLRMDPTASRYEILFSIKQQTTYKGRSFMLAVELGDDNPSPTKQQLSICYTGHRIWDGFFLKPSTGREILKWILDTGGADKSLARPG